MRLGMLWALFVASIKMFVRNRAAVFFSLVLPLIIMLIFGVLNFEGATEIQLGIVDEARSEASAALVDGLSEFEYLIISEGTRETELAAASAMFGSLGSDPGAPTFGPPVTFESVVSRDLGYIDFLVPGIVGMTIMQLGLFGVAFGFVQLKRTGALRRLFATPTSPAYFLSAQVLSRLIIGIVQVAILFGVGIWFGLQMFGDYVTLLVIVLIGSAIFLAVGFAIAGWAKTEDQAAPVANIVSLPMMFLSGVFFPREAMPDFLAGITAFMPLTYVNDALRAVVNEGANLLALGPELLGMAVWVVITFVLAVLMFRWE